MSSYQVITHHLSIECVCVHAGSGHAGPSTYQRQEKLSNRMEWSTVEQTRTVRDSRLEDGAIQYSRPE